MKIRTKILGGFMIVALVGIMTGVVGFLSAGMLSDIATQMHNIQLESASIAHVLNVSVNRKIALNILKSFPAKMSLARKRRKCEYDADFMADVCSPLCSSFHAFAVER